MRSSPAKTSAACHDHPVVITGAGGDLGRAVALRLSSQGAAVALVDNHQERLNQTYEECASRSPSVTRWCLDVSSWDASKVMADELAAAGPPAHALFNFAGLIHAGRLTDSDPQDLERVIVVDLIGTMSMTRALLPQLQQTGHGQLVNVSSAFGLVSVAGYSSYNAAKFGVRGFTEALQQEVDGTQVGITAVYLGGTKTGIMKRATYATTVSPERVQERFDKSVARLTVERAADKILAGVTEGRSQLFIGADATAANILIRLVGSQYTRLTRRMGIK